jgi:hypothetical protein
VGVQRCADAFQYIAKQLHWEDHFQAGLYRFKKNLSGELQQSLSMVEAGGTLIDHKGRPSLAMVIRACLWLEANLQLVRPTKPSITRGATGDRGSTSQSNNNNTKAGQSTRPPATPRNACYKCGETGHWARECKGEVVCLGCGDKGHVKAKCPKAPATKGKETVRAKKAVTRSSQPPPETSEGADWADQGLVTLCVLQGFPVMALVDSGANTSFVSREWVVQQGLKVCPVQGVIQQCIDGSEMPRVGVLKDVILENSSHRVVVTLEVVDLSGEQQVLIGLDLFPLLEFKITGVPFLWL